MDPLLLVLELVAPLYQLMLLGEQDKWGQAQQADNLGFSTLQQYQ